MMMIIEPFLHWIRHQWIRLFLERDKKYSLISASLLVDNDDENGGDDHYDDDGGQVLRAAHELLEQEFGQRHSPPTGKEGSLILIQEGNNHKDCFCGGIENNKNSEKDNVSMLVAGHVKITIEKEEEKASAMTKEKAIKMLERGVPRHSVEQAVQIWCKMSLEELLEAGNNKHGASSSSSSDRTTISCYIDALVVHPDLRGRGLGRYLAKAAVAVAVHHYGANQVMALAATKELACWYERLGAKRDVDAVVGKTAKANTRKITLDVQELQQAGRGQSSLTETLKLLDLDEAPYSGFRVKFDSRPGGD